MTVYWLSPTSQETNENLSPTIFIDAETTNDPSRNNGVTYEIVGGADGALFGLNSSGAYGRFTADFEQPIDANRDNVYEVEIRATTYYSDGVSNYSESGTQIFLVNVLNVQESPTLTADVASVIEGTSVSGNVLANDTDPDGNATLTVNRAQSNYFLSSAGPVNGSATFFGQYGTLTINSDGNYSYNVPQSFVIPAGAVYTEVFYYGATDGRSSLNSQITFSITGTAEAPTVEPAEVFTFGRIPKKPMKIGDFDTGVDEIRLNDRSFDGLVAGTVDGAALTGKMFVANTSGDATSKAGRAQIIYETDTGKLFYDEDGRGSDDAVQFATLIGKPTLAISDFEIF
jgi:VCBS repeat-containing protein